MALFEKIKSPESTTEEILEIAKRFDPQYFNNISKKEKDRMAADFYEVDLRTITNCLNANEEELKKNGYKVLQGKELKEFKLRFGREIDFPTKTTVLGVFDFRSFLNIGMLLTTSEKAKQVRSLMLDIVIAVINEKTGGGTKPNDYVDGCPFTHDVVYQALKSEKIEKYLKK